MAIAAIDDRSGLDDIGTSPPTLDDGACDNRLRLNDIGAPLALLDWPFGTPRFEPFVTSRPDGTGSEDAE